MSAQALWHVTMKQHSKWGWLLSWVIIFLIQSRCGIIRKMQINITASNNLTPTRKTLMINVCVCVLCVCVCVHACVHACSVASDFLWPHALYPTRLLCPRNFPGKSTGVGCHILLWGRGALPYPGIRLTYLASLALASRFFTSVPPGTIIYCW